MILIKYSLNDPHANDYSTAVTLSVDYLGKHDDGWEIIGNVQEDYYTWVNSFVAYNHKTEEIISGDFEKEISATSSKAYDDFVSKYPPTEWDYGDI